ncbi:hypothetical protein ED733_005901 [Metarhizium rileyi]|uniref:Uncharacterized protein n=1 Tax=Metarhizium rileyi (strain RCEF 4871) TaxID=1649241 RepID=A0A5C6GBT0_METRR|nr:hypothetical protein ED733_005901 [Metarhizium rileyi]
MPYVADGHDFQSARKRRWDDDHDCDVYRLYTPDKQHPELYLLNPASGFAAARKTLPLPLKRARITPDDSLYRNSLAPTQRRRQSQPREPQDQLSRASAAPNAALLTPCYICHRRPTKKSDLDSFAECQGCGERACFVCIRECHGWDADDGMSVLSEQEVLSRSFHMDDVESEQRDACHSCERSDIMLHGCCDGAGKDTKGWAVSGHRFVVCSRCCVERGRQGEVICLGCLSGMPGA